MARLTLEEDGVAFAELTYSQVIDWFDSERDSIGHRRLDSKTAAIWYAVYRSYHDVGVIPQSVRQIYYKVESYGVVPKTEAGYRRVQRQVLNMRRMGLLRYDLVTDGTRWTHKLKSYDSMLAFLENGRQAFRRDLWLSQDVYVEVWLEKEALAGVIRSVTEEYDIPLMVSRGFSSETYLYGAAEAIMAQDKPAYIYVLYDFDRAGFNAAEQVQRRLVEFGASFNLQRLAVQPEQIDQYDLSTRPPKATDIKHGWPWPYCCELDALPANVLRSIVQEAIERHINFRALEETRRIEQLERETFDEVINNMGLIPH